MSDAPKKTETTPDVIILAPEPAPITDATPSAAINNDAEKTYSESPKIHDATDATKPKTHSTTTAKPTTNPKEKTTTITAAPALTPTQAIAKNSKGIWVLSLLMVAGWAATGAGAYWYLQKESSQTSTLLLNVSGLQGEVRNAIAQQKSEQTQNFGDFKQKIITELTNIEHSANNDINKLSTEVTNHEQRLNGMQERLTALSTTSREDWLLAEAEYLLRLANQRVMLEGTPNNVVALLTRSDAIIERVSKGLGDRELFAIRQLLAQEITALKMVAPVDSQGLYLQLDALAQSISNLPTLPLREERFSKTETVPVDEKAYVSPNPSWLTQFKAEMSNVIEFLRGAISIKSEQELANPIVSQQRLQLMQLNTRLLIEQAQISLLKQDNTSYQASLKAASELTTQYYFESPARAAFAQQLNELAALDIAPALPDISQSLKLLHAYIADQHRLNSPTAGNYEGAP